MTEQEFLEEEEEEAPQPIFLEWVVTAFLALVFIFFIIKFLFL